MKKAILFVVALWTLLAVAAAALTPNQRAVLSSNEAADWALPGIVSSGGTDCYFSRALYYPSAAACGVTVTRASVATNLLPTSPAGFAYTTFANNVPRLIPGVGLLVEEARTNFLLNSAAPATQTTGSLGTGTYTLWVNGAGSATMSLGTGVGCGVGTATQGAPVSFTITVAGTCIVTVIGNLNAFQLEMNPGTVSAPLSFIPTAGATVTRPIEVPTLTAPPALTAAALSLFASGTPEVPTTFATSGQVVASIDSGSITNRLQLQRQPSTGLGNAIMETSSSVAYNQSSGAAWAQSTLGKIMVASTAATQSAAFDGAAITAGTGTPNPTGLTTVHIGQRGDGLAPFDGAVARLAIWPTLLSAATVQSLTGLP
jgi:hypothetical protein